MHGARLGKLEMSESGSYLSLSSPRQGKYVSLLMVSNQAEFLCAGERFDGVFNP
jgi:hypothetical protein